MKNVIKKLHQNVKLYPRLNVDFAVVSGLVCLIKRHNKNIFKSPLLYKKSNQD